MRGEVRGRVFVWQIMSPPTPGLFDGGQTSDGAMMHMDWNRPLHRTNTGNLNRAALLLLSSIRHFSLQHLLFGAYFAPIRLEKIIIINCGH